MIAPTQNNVQRKVFLKIGRPGYRVTKVRDTEQRKEGMMVQVHLPQIKEGVFPRRRFMSAWEQKREPPNRAYQYLIVSVFTRVCSLGADVLMWNRLLRSLMRQLHSESPPGRSKMSRRTRQGGIGRIGTLIQSSTASSSCSANLYTKTPTMSHRGHVCTCVCCLFNHLVLRYTHNKFHLS